MNTPYPDPEIPTKHSLSIKPVFKIKALQSKVSSSKKEDLQHKEGQKQEQNLKLCLLKPFWEDLLSCYSYFKLE